MKKVFFAVFSTVLILVGTADNVSFEYTPGGGALWWTSYASARTGIFLLNNGIGYVAATVNGVDGSTKHTYWGISAATGGWNYCDWATVQGQKYAKSAHHYADYRSSATTITDIYTYQVN